MVHLQFRTAPFRPYQQLFEQIARLGEFGDEELATITEDGLFPEEMDEMLGRIKEETNLGARELLTDLAGVFQACSDEEREALLHLSLGQVEEITLQRVAADPEFPKPVRYLAHLREELSA